MQRDQLGYIADAFTKVRHESFSFPNVALLQCGSMLLGVLTSAVYFPKAEP